MRLLSACGLETVLDNPLAGWFKGANAGAESLILGEGEAHPYVVKSPWTYQFVEQLVTTESIIVDEVIIPIRRLSEAAASRLIIEAAQVRKMIPSFDLYEDPWADFGQTPGGALYSLEMIDQERILGRALHKLLETLEENNVPYRLLSFPKFVSDVDYAYDRLGHLFPDLTKEDFGKKFSSAVSKDQVRVGAEIEETRVAKKVVVRAAPVDQSLGVDAAFHHALKRENAELKEQVADLEQKLSVAKAAEALGHLNVHAEPCGNPDIAPLGLSYGDAIIGPEGLAGWHWMTQTRPDQSFGFQLAFSDTIGIGRYRFKAAGNWAAWAPLTPV